MALAKAFSICLILQSMNLSTIATLMLPWSYSRHAVWSSRSGLAWRSCPGLSWLLPSPWAWAPVLSSPVRSRRRGTPTGGHSSWRYQRVPHELQDQRLRARHPYQLLNDHLHVVQHALSHRDWIHLIISSTNWIFCSFWLSDPYFEIKEWSLYWSDCDHDHCIVMLNGSVFFVAFQSWCAVLRVVVVDGSSHKSGGLDCY